MAGMHIGSSMVLQGAATHPKGFYFLKRQYSFSGKQRRRASLQVARQAGQEDDVFQLQNSEQDMDRVEETYKREMGQGPTSQPGGGDQPVQEGDQQREGRQRRPRDPQRGQGPSGYALRLREPTTKFAWEGTGRPTDQVITANISYSTSPRKLQSVLQKNKQYLNLIHINSSFSRLAKLYTKERNQRRQVLADAHRVIEDHLVDELEWWVARPELLTARACVSIIFCCSKLNVELRSTRRGAKLLARLLLDMCRELHVNLLPSFEGTQQYSNLTYALGNLYRNQDLAVERQLVEALVKRFMLQQGQNYAHICMMMMGMALLKDLYLPPVSVLERIETLYTVQINSDNPLGVANFLWASAHFSDFYRPMGQFLDLVIVYLEANSNLVTGEAIRKLAEAFVLMKLDASDPAYNQRVVTILTKLQATWIQLTRDKKQVYGEDVRVYLEAQHQLQHLHQLSLEALQATERQATRYMSKFSAFHVRGVLQGLRGYGYETGDEFMAAIITRLGTGQVRFSAPKATKVHILAELVTLAGTKPRYTNFFQSYLNFIFTATPCDSIHTAKALFQSMEQLRQLEIEATGEQLSLFVESLGDFMFFPEEHTSLLQRVGQYMQQCEGRVDLSQFQPSADRARGWITRKMDGSQLSEEVQGYDLAFERLQSIAGQQSMDGSSQGVQVGEEQSSSVGQLLQGPELKQVS